MRPLPGIRRIAVLRANGLGDLMFALPALDALRAAYPNASITLLGKPWHAGFLRGRPGPVDEVFVLPAIPGITVGEDDPGDPASAAGAVERLRERRFDLALQLFGGGRSSNPFVSSLRAAHTAGLQAEDAQALDVNVPYRYFQSEVFRLLEVVATVGAAPVTLEPRLQCTLADHAEADEALGAASGSGPPLVTIHPGAGDGRRRWPVESFAAVAKGMQAAGCRVALLGSQEDRELTAALAADAGPGVLDLGGRLSLGGLAGALRSSALLIADDSGPLHLARAVGTATVGIYWCGNLINAGPIGRSHHRPLCSWRLECPVCGTNCITGRCDHHASFVADVPVEEVLREARSLLASFEHPRPLV